MADRGGAVEQDARVAGVLGGLGPLATAEFLALIVGLTDAETDQDHLDLIVSQHSSTPDRTAYLLGLNSSDPGPVLSADAQMLERAGADFLVLPCNTAHAMVGQIRKATDLDVVDILEVTVAEVSRRSGGPTKVGLLATDGTRRIGLYQDELTNSGHEPVVPDAIDQAALMDLIYRQVKGGEVDNYRVLAEVISHLRDLGAEYFVLGCTELRIPAADIGIIDDPTIVDSSWSLAVATIKCAGKNVRRTRTMQVAHGSAS